jgi:hypothetical protein
MFCEIFCLHYGTNHKTNAEVEGVHLDSKAPKHMGKIKQKYIEAPILIALNQGKKFHVHMDSSNLAVGAMLSQNLDDKCD